MATVKVGADGKAPKGLKAGDKVVTAGGTYTIQQVNKDGSGSGGPTSHRRTKTSASASSSRRTAITPR